MARLTVPAMAVGARPVGRAVEQQLRPVADGLTGHVIEDCGCVIPPHRPGALLEPLRPVTDRRGRRGERRTHA